MPISPFSKVMHTLNKDDKMGVRINRDAAERNRKRFMRSGLLSDSSRGNKISMSSETVSEIGMSGPIGIAFAVISESEPHYHKIMTEWYIVTKGSGTLYLNGKGVSIREGDVLKIPPTTVHYVLSSDEVQLYVITLPPWSKDDHHLVITRRPS